MRRVRSTKGVRLWDLKHGHKLVVTCGCGRITHFLPGFLERHYRLPSDMLVYDLRYRLRCGKCNSRDRFEITIEESR